MQLLQSDPPPAPGFLLASPYASVSEAVASSATLLVPLSAAYDAAISFAPPASLDDEAADPSTERARTWAIIAGALQSAIVCLPLPHFIYAGPYHTLLNLPIAVCSVLGFYGAVKRRWDLVRCAALCWTFYTAVIVLLGLLGIGLALLHSAFACQDRRAIHCKGRELKGFLLFIVMFAMVVATSLAVPFVYLQMRYVSAARASERHRQFAPMVPMTELRHEEA